MGWTHDELREERKLSHMFNITTQEVPFGAQTLTFETGRMARQADGAVFAKYGDTTILATAVGAKKAKEGVLSPDGSLSGKILRNRSYSRWFLQTRSQTFRKRNLGQPLDRSSDPSAVCRRFLQ